MMSLPARMIFVLLSGALYLGLAILGWGGFAAFFAHEALVGLTFVLAVVLLLSLFAGGNVSPGEREDRGNRWVLPVLVGLGLLNGWLPAWTDRHDVWTIGGEVTRWTGVALFAIGCAIRLWPVYVLGDRFSGLVAIQHGHTLVTTGIYSVIRHPSYLGLLVGSLGWPLAFRSLPGLLVGALILPPLLARIRSEERLLHETFGAEYEAYRGRTARLIPGVW